MKRIFLDAHMCSKNAHATLIQRLYNASKNAQKNSLPIAWVFVVLWTLNVLGKIFW